MANQRSTPENGNSNEAEFVRLLTLYQPNIFLYVRSLVINSTDASEILQETNLVLWEKRDQFKAGTNFLAWAFQIARYKLKENQFRNKRKARCFSDVLIDELALQSPHFMESHGDWIDELRRCIEKLASRDRELITWRYASRMSCKNIAESVARPVRWVHNALARIREELLDCIVHSSGERKDR